MHRGSAEKEESRWEVGHWEAAQPRWRELFCLLFLGKVFPLFVLSSRFYGDLISEGMTYGAHLQPPLRGVYAGLIPKLCVFFHKLFTGSARSSGAGTEAKIIPVSDKQKGARKRMNSFGVSTDCS